MTEHVNSYYAASANKHAPYPTLTEQLECDVCVIGAGYTGLSSALHLVEKGYKVVVLEAARVGFGASGRNGGQIVNSYSRDIDTIEANCPPDQARLLGSMLFEGGQIIRERIKRYNIQCDLQEGASLPPRPRSSCTSSNPSTPAGRSGATTSWSCSMPRGCARWWRATATSALCSTRAAAIFTRSIWRWGRLKPSASRGADLRTIRRHQYHPRSTNTGQDRQGGGEGALCGGGRQCLPR